MSHESLLTQKNEITPTLANHVLPYVKSHRKLGNDSQWLNDTLDDALKMLNPEASKSFSQSRITEMKTSTVPDVKDSVHVLKNSGDFYVQK